MEEPVVEPEVKIPTVTLVVPKSVEEGAKFEVGYDITPQKGDRLTIVPKEAKGKDFGNFVYFTPEKQAAVELTALMQEQIAEVQYFHSASNQVIAKAPIQITKALVSLKAAKSVTAGSEIEVIWEGPSHEFDQIVITEVGAPPTANQLRAYTRKSKVKDGKNIATVIAPIKLGKAEIRYIAGQDYSILASVPLEIVPSKVTLSASAEVEAGSLFWVTWSGPANKLDKIVIVKKGESRETHAKNRGYPKKKKPNEAVELTAPIGVGAYEIVYISGQGNKKLGSIPITLTKAHVSLDVPESVKGGEKFEVNWVGPANRTDKIVILKKGAAKEKKSQHRSYPKKDKSGKPNAPVKLTAPEAPGAYEIVYVTGQGSHQLHRVPIRVSE